MQAENHTLSSSASPRLDAQPIKPWSAPRLVRMGTVAEHTAKVKSTGHSDGGFGTRKRS
jgi:hypothetical protein